MDADGRATGLLRLITGAFGVVTSLSFSLAPAVAQDLLTQGDELLKAGKHEEARVVLERAVSAAPGSARANHLLGRSCVRLGDQEKALTPLARAVEIEPGNTEYRLALAEVYGWKTRTASFLSAPRWAGRWKGELEKAFELDPDNLKARDRLIQYLVNAPAIGGGDKPRAKRLAQESIPLDATQGRLLLAYVRRRTGDTEGAMTEYQTILLAEPGNGRAHQGLGLLFLGQKLYEPAERHFRQYAAAHPDEPNAYDSLGDLYAARGMLPAAASEYLKALEIDPRFSTSRFKLAEAFERQGMRDESMKQYEALIQLTPGHERAEEARKRLKALGR